MLIKIRKKITDDKARKKLAVTERKKIYLKFMRLVSLKQLNHMGYIKYQRKLNDLPKYRFKNACYFTNRGRGVLRKTRLSRHQIKDKFRYLHGLIRSSW